MASSQTLELLLYPPYFPVDQKGNPLFTIVVPYNRNLIVYRYVLRYIKIKKTSCTHYCQTICIELFGR